MSIFGDDAFAKEVIESTAKIVAKQRAECLKELNAERSAREALEKKVDELNDKCTSLEARLNTLESMTLAHKCEEVLAKVFTAGLLEVIGQSAPNVPVIQDGTLNATPNPGLEEPIPGPSGVKRKSKEGDGKKKKKGKTSQATQSFVQTLDEVQSPLRESLAPFIEKGVNDYLNDVQRALVVYRTHTAIQNGENITDAYIIAVIAEGNEHNIWDAEFNPSDKESFFLYVRDKIHNLRKKINRRQSLDNQQGLVAKYVKDIMVGEMVEITGDLE